MNAHHDPSVCIAARMQASAWIDGELREPEALLAHLELCEACRAHADDLRRTRSLFAPLREPEPVLDLWPAIAARTRPSRRPLPAGKRLHLVRIAAACIGFAGTAAVLDATTPRPREEPSRELAGNLRLPAALHQETSAPLELQELPEQRLLASLDPSHLERR